MSQFDAHDEHTLYTLEELFDHFKVIEPEFFADWSFDDFEKWIEEGAEVGIVKLFSPQ
jgi:hypothetical protein